MARYSGQQWWQVVDAPVTTSSAYFAFTDTLGYPVNDHCLNYLNQMSDISLPLPNYTNIETKIMEFPSFALHFQFFFTPLQNYLNYQCDFWFFYLSNVQFSTFVELIDIVYNEYLSYVCPCTKKKHNECTFVEVKSKLNLTYYYYHFFSFTLFLFK